MTSRKVASFEHALPVMTAQSVKPYVKLRIPDQACHPFHAKAATLATCLRAVPEADRCGITNQFADPFEP